MRIYISHPYGGEPGNKAEIERIAEALAVKDKANVYISPIHCLGYLYDKVDYLHGVAPREGSVDRNSVSRWPNGCGPCRSPRGERG